MDSKQAPTLHRLLLAALLGMGAGLTQAQGGNDYQPHASLIEAVEDFLAESAKSLAAERIDIRVRPVNQRLKLSRCSQKPQAFFPNRPDVIGHTTVGVSCPDKPSWKIYLGADVAIYKQVVVTRQPVARHAVMQKTSLARELKNVSKLPQGYYEDISAVSGAVSRRAVRADTVVTPGMLQPRHTVKRGEIVTLRASSGLLQVRMRGKALANAQTGEQVSVLNLSSKKQVQGKVIEPGLVAVDL
jgi:flagella basal body P-ring formation protein FlgA